MIAKEIHVTQPIVSWVCVVLLWRSVFVREYQSHIVSWCDIVLRCIFQVAERKLSENQRILVLDDKQQRSLVYSTDHSKPSSTLWLLCKRALRWVYCWCWSCWCNKVSMMMTSIGHWTDTTIVGSTFHVQAMRSVVSSATATMIHVAHKICRRTTCPSSAVTIKKASSIRFVERSSRSSSFQWTSVSIMHIYSDCTILTPIKRIEKCNWDWSCIVRNDNSATIFEHDTLQCRRTRESFGAAVGTTRRTRTSATRVAVSADDRKCAPARRTTATEPALCAWHGRRPLAFFACLWSVECCWHKESHADGVERWHRCTVKSMEVCRKYRHTKYAL